MPLRMILVGPPGVGKGTQSSLLEARLGAKPLSSGMIFRAEIDAQTDLGELAKSYIDRGELVPNGVTIQMMLKRLRTSEVQQKGFILDGFPRTVRQAEALDEELRKAQIDLDVVVSLEVDDQVIVDRLSGRLGCTKCGAIYHRLNKPPKREGFCDNCNSPVIVREDDNPETIKERLRVFRENTAPVVDHYAAQGKLVRVESSRDPEVVYADIVAGIGS
ncbi:adenylate kinase [Armatimonadetes bacterium Uphvl-Ar1]|nr:adenylate kinase [Armatimonadetes bacterium Uphvl-Ar1]